MNVLVVKEGNEQTDKTKALVAAITSQEVKDYIEKTYNGREVVPPCSPYNREPLTKWDNECGADSSAPRVARGSDGIGTLGRKIVDGGGVRR